MDQQQPNRFEEQAREAKNATRKLKKRMLIAIACMVVFAVIAVPLIQFLDNWEQEKKQNNAEQNRLPPTSITFYTPDYDCDIMKEQEYLDLNRTIYYCDERSGVTEVLDESNYQKYGDAVPVLVDMIEAIIYGNADAYNDLFSENYYANNKPEYEFTMQRVYDIMLTRVNETTVNDEKLGAYTQYEFEVEYKIHKNDGTFRIDIGHDESRTQYFILSDSTSDAVLIDQILTYNYQ